MFLKERKYTEKEQKVIRYITDALQISFDDSDKVNPVNDIKTEKLKTVSILRKQVIYSCFKVSKYTYF